MTSSMLRSSRFSVTVATGRRVPLNTQAPLTLPGDALGSRTVGAIERCHGPTSKLRLTGSRVGRHAGSRRAPELLDLLQPGRHPVPTGENPSHQHSLRLNQRLAASQTAKPKSDIEPRLRLGTQGRVKISSSRTTRRERSGSLSINVAAPLPSERVGVGADLHDSADSGVLIFVAEDLLDRRERVLTAAVARCDPLNLVGIV